jgi:hypothetical protein
MMTPVKSALLAVCGMLLSNYSLAWANHTLISQGMLESIPEVAQAKHVKVESLESFLLANEDQLVDFLAQEDKWMSQHLFHYDPLPSTLAFKATGNPEDIRERFSHAIRINPNTPLNLYLQLTPGRDVSGKSMLKASEITVYEDNRYLDNINIIKLQAGQRVAPLDVVVSANDEPDHGLDIGLYTDSKTAHGKIYGFGQQPFGNPNLEYGTQAPFHMGFYHESDMMFAAGGFLKRTYPEYRIQQFKRLSQFAFTQGHAYWGWRFMGLGLHYVGDFSNPYHVTPVPGNSTASTIWVGLLNIIGITGPQTDAVQIVSNRHTAIEEFQEQVMKKAYTRHNLQHPTLQATKNSESVGEYQDTFIVDVFAKGAYEQADTLDEVILRNMPAKFVADNRIEFSTLPERQLLLQKIREHKGQAGINELEKTLVRLLGLFSGNGKSYVQGILQHSADN